MQRVHFHPDGKIFIEDGELLYVDTPANFQLDSGQTFMPPPGYNELQYIPGQGVFFADGKSRDFSTDSWGKGDAILSALPAIIAAKNARENPPNTLAQARDDMQLRIESAALSRIQSHIPRIQSIESITLLKEIWPMLNVGAAPAIISSVRGLYLYMENRKNWAETASLPALEAYDPAIDPSWPI